MKRQKQGKKCLKHIDSIKEKLKKVFQFLIYVDFPVRHEIHGSKLPVLIIFSWMSIGHYIHLKVILPVTHRCHYNAMTGDRGHYTHSMFLYFFFSMVLTSNNPGLGRTSERSKFLRFKLVKNVIDQLFHRMNSWKQIKKFTNKLGKGIPTWIIWLHCFFVHFIHLFIFYNYFLSGKKRHTK